MSAVGKFASGAWHAVAGGGSDPGALGTGKYGVNTVDIDKDAYYNNDALNANKNTANQQMDLASNRQAPTAQAAQLGPAAQTNASLATATTGNATLAHNTRIGSAQNVQSANIDRQDEQFRNQQSGLASRLDDASQGKGPSLASAQLGQANAAAAAQRMASAASDRGFGNSAATNRQLAYQQGAAQQANAIASGQAKIQEQQAAQQALGNVLSSSRQQDIGVNTSQAGLTQQANLANQDANNNFKLKQAELNQQTSLQNAAAGNQFGLANMSAENANSQANANALNTVGMNNTAAQNDVSKTNAAMAQQTELANQAAKLQQMGLNDAQIKAMLGIDVSIDQQETANKQAYNDLAVNQNIGVEGLKSGAYNNAATARSGLISSVAGGVMGAMMSDENQKENISDVDKADVNKFLNTPTAPAPTLAPSPVAPSPMNTDHINAPAAIKPITDADAQKAKDAKFDAMIKGLSSMNSGKGGYGDMGSKMAAGANMAKMISGLMSKSDERSKKNISNASKPDVSEFLDTMGGHKYDYKDPSLAGADDKTHYSPMAQELEKSKMGKSMVYTDPQSGTKYVDYGRGYGALMAATAEINKRLNKLEKK